MNTLDIELNGIQQEMSLDILLNESNRFNNIIKSNNGEIIQEGIKDALKSLKDKVVNFFKWLGGIIKKFFNTIKNFIKEKFSKKKELTVIDYVNFFANKYKGETIVFGEFQNNICEIKDLFYKRLQSGIVEIERINNSILGDIERTKDLGGEDNVSFVDTWYKDHIEQEFMKQVLDTQYHYINRDSKDIEIMGKIRDAYLESTPKNTKDKFIFAIDSSKPQDFKNQYNVLKKVYESNILDSINKLQSSFEKKIKGFENTANKLCEKLDNPKILEIYMNCTAKSSQLVMNAVKAYYQVNDLIDIQIGKSFLKMINEYERINKND